MDNKATFSFGFTKRSEVKKLQSSAIKDGDQDKKEETDYLVSVEDNQIKRCVVFVLCDGRLLNVHKVHISRFQALCLAGQLSCRAMSNYVRNFDVKNY